MNLLFVLLIINRSGNTVSVHRTRMGARLELWRYVKDRWDSNLFGRKIPKKKSLAIKQYFDKYSGVGPDDEFFEIFDRKELLS